MANLDYNDFRPCDCVWRMVLPANSLKLLLTGMAPSYSGHPAGAAGGSGVDFQRPLHCRVSGFVQSCAAPNCQSSARHHVDRNRGLRDLDAQLEQFAMDLGWSFRKGQLAARQLASLFCMGQAWKIATVANLTHRRKIASSRKIPERTALLAARCTCLK